MVEINEREMYTFVTDEFYSFQKRRINLEKIVVVGYNEENGRYLSKSGIWYDKVFLHETVNDAMTSIILLYRNKMDQMTNEYNLKMEKLKKDIDSIVEIVHQSRTIKLLKEIVFDDDGNAYHLVKIGNQVWMVENLRTTKYNDGTSIPLIRDGKAWSVLKTPGYCWYNNDIGHKEPYGALYNWYTVNTGKLAPEGWCIPTDEEWTVLSDYLGGCSVAGGKLKETGFDHWEEPNIGATNEVGFCAIPGNCRNNDGSFYSMNRYGYWWSSTEYDSSSVYNRGLSFYYGTMNRYSDDKGCGFSVRLVMKRY
jgi:uncharacterized protein (TIGR02145 family)